MLNNKKLEKLIKLNQNIRKDILEISFRAGVGHIGSALSIVEIMTVLYGHVMNVNAKKPLSKMRDKLILSKGHAAAALYSALHRKGYFSRKELLSFCQDGGIFGTHPLYDLKRGIELSTGSLGHGLSVGVGMALALKIDKKSEQKIFVVLSDGELNEGSTWEAIMLASHHKLDNLIAIVDANSYQAFGRTEEVIKLTPLEKKWAEFGWSAKKVDGHNIKKILNVFKKIPFRIGKPSVLIANTIMANGLPYLEDKQEGHYLSITKDQYISAIKVLKK